MRAKIVGTGSCLPEKVITNEFLTTLVDTSDEWITSRTGIQERHVATGEESSASMACEAARKALEDAGMTAEEIELIIVATCTADTLVPSTACDIQGRLGAVNAAAFDLNAACSGFVYALNTADSYFQCGMYHNALLVGVESLSRIVDWKDRSVCVLFGDGAGAAVVKAVETGGLIASDMGSDGARCEELIVKSRQNHNPYEPEEKPTDYLYMDGPGVFKFAVRTVPKTISKTLAKTDIKLEDVDWILLHQANMRINQAIARKLDVPIEKLPHNMERCGNTSGASIPILLDETRKQGLVKEGDTVILSGFGAGLTWATALLTM